MDAVIARVRQGSDRRVWGSCCLTLIWTRHPRRCFLRHSPIGIGPRCSVQYDNGRVEECIKGEVVNDGMERIRVHMAKELAQWKASIQNKIS